MSWFKPKVSQEYFNQFEAQVIRVIDNQRREIEKLKKDISDLHTQLSDFKVRMTTRVTELEASPNRPLAGSPITRQEKPREVFQGHSNVTHRYTDSSPDLSTVMLISALASDSSSCDSYSSSSSDSSSSCGGD